MMVTTVRNIVEKARRAYIWQSETVSINKKAHLYEQVHWSKHRQDVFDDYWISNYGKKIPNKWHRLYESINGVFNVEYFPERLFTSLYEPTVNRIDYCRTLRDKSFLQTMFGHVDEIRIPKTLLLSSGRYFYDGSQNIITKEEALSLVNNIGEAVIKPTIVHGSGVNIVIVDIKNGIDSISGEAIGSILSRYGSNFCIQEKIIPHQSYKALYEGSINTIKIMTYIIEGSIYHDPIFLQSLCPFTFRYDPEILSNLISESVDKIAANRSCAQNCDCLKTHSNFTSLLIALYHRSSEKPSII